MPKGQTKEVIPTKDGAKVVADTGYEYLSKVKLKAIPYKVTKNSKGADIITIGE